jgi:hypothetical protein
MLRSLGIRRLKIHALMEANETGKLALLQSSIILNYKQLRFLVARFIIGVQVIGHVTSIVYRTTYHLPVIPIEAICFAFSMLVIICSVVHSLGVIRRKPLVIYLDPTQQQEMLDKCASTRRSSVDDINHKVQRSWEWWWWHS